MAWETRASRAAEERAGGRPGTPFRHCNIAELGKFAPKPFDLVAFKHALFSWQELTREDGWNALFLSNHDLPRQVSFYADDTTHRRAAARTLATVLHLLKGTPFVYQGEEIGMTNAQFERIDQYRDLETLNHFQEQIVQGVPPEVFLDFPR